MPLWHVATPIEVVVFAAVLAAAIAVELSTRSGFIRERRVALRGLLGNGVISLAIVIDAVNAERLIPAGVPFGRISLAPGLWLAVLGGYILILSSLNKLERGTVLRYLVSLLSIAVLIALAAAGEFGHLSLYQEYIVRSTRFSQQFATHMALSLGATGLAVVVGIPLGLWAFRREKAERPIFLVVNTVQTIPSLALFGLMIAPLSYLSHRFATLRALGIEGIGWAPALIALTLYALLPIVRNTYTSMKVLDPAVVEAGKGMGMGRRQIMFRIEIPLSTPIILGGLRTSLVQAIGNTTVAALIGAGGFGIFIFQGLGQAVPDLILLGTIPVIALAVVVDKLMEVLIRVVTPTGMRIASTEVHA